MGVELAVGADRPYVDFKAELAFRGDRLWVFGSS